MILLRNQKPELLESFLAQLLSGVMLVFSSYCGESRLCARFYKLVEYDDQNPCCLSLLEDDDQSLYVMISCLNMIMVF